MKASSGNTWTHDAILKTCLSFLFLWSIEIGVGEWPCFYFTSPSHFFPSSFIHAAWLQTLTWDIRFHLSPTPCVILSRSLHCSLYLSVFLPLHLLLSNSNWYDISWSSDIAFTFGLFLAGSVVSMFPLHRSDSGAFVLSYKSICKPRLPKCKRV